MNAPVYPLTRPLTRLRAGQKGTISAIRGGHGMQQRLEALGIRQGATITKVSAQWMKGPVILRYNNTEVAVGHGMARGIFVTLPGENTTS